jgi:aryl-alcohol dehydrogenase-like predicted oxidoreductase
VGHRHRAECRRVAPFLGLASEQSLYNLSARTVELEVIEQHRTQLEQYEALCKEIGEEPADVALAWLLHSPAVTAPIIGPRTKAQLTGSLRALEISLSTDTNRRLDEIWPGPGGEAPEAYAW